MPIPLVAAAIALVKKYLLRKGAAWVAAAIVFVFGESMLDSVIGWFSTEDPQVAAQLQQAKQPPKVELNEIEKQELLVQRQVGLTPDPFQLPARVDQFVSEADNAIACGKAATICLRPLTCCYPTCGCAQRDSMKDLVLDCFTEALLEERAIDRLLSGGGKCSCDR